MNKLIIAAIAFTALSGCSATTSSMSPVQSAYAGGGERSVAVLSDLPMTMTLEPTGQSFNPSWSRTSRGYEATIRFPASYASQYRTMKLKRADGRGWSEWRAAEMSYLRHSDVRKSDPACVGGRSWCATRGL